MKLPPDIATHPLHDVATRECRAGVGEDLLSHPAIEIDTDVLLAMLVTAWVRGHDFKAH